MKTVAKIVLVFFIIFSLVPTQGWAEKGKKKTGKGKPVVEEKKEERHYLPIKNAIYPLPPMAEGEGLVILREDVSVIVRDGAGDIYEGWVPSGTVVVVQEGEIVRLYKTGVPVLNKVLLKDLQKPLQAIEGEKLKLLFLEQNLSSKEKKKVTPSKDQKTSFFSSLGLGNGKTESLPQSEVKKKKKKTLLVVLAVVVVSGIVLVLTQKKDDKPGGPGGGGHPAPP
ncbi:MAG: hypothetical protein HY773_00645 [Candidatus Terrybacteria bacterium]|nr:hypothetical protein [Candidatus Terrybacteria bacterium]